MKNEKTKNILIYLLLSLVFFTFLFSCFCSGLNITKAAEIEYSNVLDDLQKDNTFNKNNYNTVIYDPSINLIQIAESVNKELFIYTYQPSGDSKKLKASSINISTGINDALDFKNYKLKFLNSNGVFYKYKVENFTILNKATRYYIISSIYRPFDIALDKPATDGNVINEVAYNVGKEYSFFIKNGIQQVNVIDNETIVVTDKFVGYCRYKGGFHLAPTLSDLNSHFIAFSTDKKIENLLEADVYYTEQKVTSSRGPGSSMTKYWEPEDKIAKLTYLDKVEQSGGGLFAPVYKWNRIESVSEFLKGDTSNIYTGALIDVSSGSLITESGKQALKGKQWVLRFAETKNSTAIQTGTSSSSSYFVGNVSILRLKFRTNGKVYNLGVVDNKQTGSKDPVNEEKLNISLTDLAKLIIIIILVIVILLIFHKPIFYILSLPFKLIKKIYEDIRSRL